MRVSIHFRDLGVDRDQVLRTEFDKVQGIQTDGPFLIITEEDGSLIIYSHEVIAEVATTPPEETSGR